MIPSHDDDASGSLGIDRKGEALTLGPADEDEPQNNGSCQWMRGRRVFICCGVAAIVLFAIFYWGLALRFVRHHEHLTAAQEATAVTDARRNTLALFAAIGAGISLFYTALRHNLDRDANAVTRDEHMTTRYTTAVDQLAHESMPSIRLGGMYALERLAKDSEKDAETILEVLCAWVRDESLKKKEKEQEKVSTDFQAALTIIGRFHKHTPHGGIDLSTANLRGANLVGADLRGANLVGADLRETNCGGVDFREADLQGVLLQGASLKDAVLTFMDLQGVNFGRVFPRTSDSEGEPLRGADLEGADLRWVNLRAAHLEGLNLSKAKFEGATLVGTQFEGATLVEASFVNARLEEAQLQGANLKNADFEGAHITGARFIRAQLQGAKLRRVVLRRDQNVEDAYFTDVVYSQQTMWPYGFHLPAGAQLDDAGSGK